MKTSINIDGDEEKVEEIQQAPVEQIVTLKLKTRAFWKEGLQEAGTRFDYPKAEADRLLTTTELFEVA
jgi:hypothetical protein